MLDHPSGIATEILPWSQLEVPPEVLPVIRPGIPSMIPSAMSSQIPSDVYLGISSAIAFSIHSKIPLKDVLTSSLGMFFFNIFVGNFYGKSNVIHLEMSSEIPLATPSVLCQCLWEFLW